MEDSKKGDDLDDGIRAQSNTQIYIKKRDPQTIDIIQQTKKLVKDLNEKQRFSVAKKHLINALQYKTPRLDTYSESMSRVFKVCYNIQTSNIWQTFLLTLSYVYMYLVIWTHKPMTLALFVIQSIILGFMWVDSIMEIYHKSYQVLRLTSRFQLRFYVRIISLILLSVDQILVVTAEIPVRPFLLLRCLLPIFYDSNVRKSFEALLSSYKDFFVYIFFYTIVIVGFAVIANQLIILPEDAGEDPLTNNYRELDKTIFIMYVMSSYDSYPDNQLIAIKTSLWIYGFFICFIFLNVFFFVTIPATVLFGSFRETRSKIILIDQIKQQHSLIMSFVCLGQQNFNINQNKLIRFLLYVYKNKVRYVDHITEICLKLDDNNNGIIHVNEYMQLCKILQADSSMMPPKFPDWDKWLEFRKFVNNRFMLKKIILSNKFKFLIGIIILLTFVNSILSIYTEILVFDLIDDVLIIFYCIQIVAKIIGLGPQNFFKDPWNKLDFLLITISLGLELAPEKFIPHNSDVLFKMTRIFRITIFIKLIEQKNKLRSQIYIKATRLVSQMAIIIPIVLKFFPLYMISYYILGILGMQIFRKQAMINNQQSPYNNYDQFSNFNTFLGSQFIFVQILVQAGWSMVAFHHAFKFGFYALTMLFFVFCHVIIVIVLSSLLRGITWQVYYTVHQEFNERTNKQLRRQMREQALQKKKQKIEEVKAKADEKQLLIPDNLITKELYENKIDEQIFKKLKNFYEKNRQTFSARQKNKQRSKMVSHLIQDRKILIDEIDHLERQSQDDENYSSHEIIMNRLLQSLNIKDIEDLKQEDIQQEMERVLSKIILHHKIQYSQAVVYPKNFTQYLQNKLLPPKLQMLKMGFNIDKDVIGNRDSVQFLTYCLNVLLGIQVSERQQKAKIIKNMVKQGIISQQQSIKVLTKKLTEKDSSFDSNWIMRKAFLSDTNEQLIKKFQIEYFSSVYGKSFKQINKVTIQPLLRLQSRLTYCLRNLLRHRQIKQQQFFTVLATIEDTISNKLLKKGSLFKFVFQIQSISDIWFSIQLKQSNEMKVHFIKSGIWIYTKSMKPNQIRYGKDIFNWERIADRSDKNSCQKYIKLLYQSFQSLAFCLINDKNFFASKPQKQVYDLFSFYHDVENVQRLQARELSISKIMLVILSKQDERNQDSQLSYALSDIKIQESEQDTLKKAIMFRFDQSEHQTFQKLKRMELMDYQRIVESEGIPFSFIVNLMTEIQDILKLYQMNFIYQLEQFLNSKFNEIT